MGESRIEKRNKNGHKPLRDARPDVPEAHSTGERRGGSQDEGIAGGLRQRPRSSLKSKGIVSQVAEGLPFFPQVDAMIKSPDPREEGRERRGEGGGAVEKENR